MKAVAISMGLPFFGSVKAMRSPEDRGFSIACVRDGSVGERCRGGNLRDTECRSRYGPSFVEISKSALGTKSAQTEVCATRVEFGRYLDLGKGGWETDRSTIKTMPESRLLTVTVGVTGASGAILAQKALQ